MFKKTRDRRLRLTTLMYSAPPPLHVPGIIRPLEQGLTLPGSAIPVACSAVFLYLRDMPLKSAPPSDLAIIVRTTAPHIIAAVPLKPAARIFVVDPSLLSPVRQRPGRVHAEAVQCRVMAFGAKLGLGEPVCRKFRRAVRHVFPAEDAESEHLFRGQLRAEIGVKVPANRLSQEIFIALLHQIIDFDTHGFHLYYPHWSQNVKLHGLRGFLLRGPSERSVGRITAHLT